MRGERKHAAVIMKPEIIMSVLLGGDSRSVCACAADNKGGGESWCGRGSNKTRDSSPTGPAKIRKFDRERLGNIVISGAALQDERRHRAAQPRHSEIRIRVRVLK